MIGEREKVEGKSADTSDEKHDENTMKSTMKKDNPDQKMMKKR